MLAWHFYILRTINVNLPLSDGREMFIFFLKKKRRKKNV